MQSHHLDILLNELFAHLWGYLFLALVLFACVFAIGAGAAGMFRTRRSRPLTS